MKRAEDTNTQGKKILGYPFIRLVIAERERDLLQVPHFFVGTLQPLQADWKGRPQCVCCLSANVQISLFGLPQGKSPGREGGVFLSSSVKDTVPIPFLPVHSPEKHQHNIFSPHPSLTLCHLPLATVILPPPPPSNSFSHHQAFLDWCTYSYTPAETTHRADMQYVLTKNWAEMQMQLPPPPSHQTPHPPAPPRPTPPHRIKVHRSLLATWPPFSLAAGTGWSC